MAQAIVSWLRRTYKVEFQLDIKNISNLDHSWSEELLIQDIPWQVGVKKHDFEGEPRLAVYFYFLKQKVPENRSVVASATFTLLPFEKSKLPVVFRCDPYIFEEYGENFGRHKLIKWNELLDANNCFVDNDAIKLSIEIEAAKQAKSCASISKQIETDCNTDHIKSFVIVTHVESLWAEKCKIQFQNMPWHVTIYKGRMGMFSFRLENGSKQILCKMEVSIKLLSSQGEEKNFHKVEGKLFDALTVLEIKLLSWDELVKPENGYINENEVTMEIEMKASKLKRPRDEEEGDDQASGAISTRIKLEPSSEP